MQADIETRGARRSVRFIFWLLLVISALALLSAIELLAYLKVVPLDPDRQPFLLAFDATDGEATGTRGDKGEQLNLIDPFLGFAWEANEELRPGSSSYPGFVVSGDTDNARFRIMTLGGSTTDGGGQRNWPLQLHEMVERRYADTVLFNGGTSGYSSSQELLKLVRDAVPMAPDVIVAMTGVNDLGFIHSVDATPMIHPHAEDTMRALGLLPRLHDEWAFFMPNTVRLIAEARERNVLNGAEGRGTATGASFGIEYSAQPVDNWFKNIRTAHAVAQEFGILYLAFLQPVLGANLDRVLGEEDQKLFEENVGSNAHYSGIVSEFYDTAAALCAPLDYCVDIHRLFPDGGNYYGDARHPNPQGYRLIAARVLEELERRGAVRSDAPANGHIPLYARPSYPAHWSSSYFRAWGHRGDVRIAARAAESPNRLFEADAVSLLSEDAAIYQAKRDLSVNAGDVLRGSVTLWAEQPVQVEIVVARHCGDGDYEASSLRVLVTKLPTDYAVTHRFDHDHACARLMLRHAVEDATFYAWNASLDIDE